MMRVEREGVREGRQRLGNKSRSYGHETGLRLLLGKQEGRRKQAAKKRPLGVLRFCSCCKVIKWRPSSFSFFVLVAPSQDQLGIILYHVC